MVAAKGRARFFCVFCGQRNTFEPCNITLNKSGRVFSNHDDKILTIMFILSNSNDNRLQMRLQIHAVCAAVLFGLIPSFLAAETKPQKRARRNASRSNAKKGNRSVSLQSKQRDRALAALPPINSFREKPSDRFLIDNDVIRTGHPYKGKNAKRPHTGGHIYFKNPDKPSSPDDLDALPAIYAVADGVITRIDYSFRLREMFESALGRRVANTRYGIGLMFAKRDGQLVEMHYSIGAVHRSGRRPFLRQVHPGQTGTKRSARET